MFNIFPTHRQLFSEKTLDCIFDSNPFEIFNVLCSESPCSGHSKFKVDVLEKDGKWIVKAALPGINREDIKLNVENDILEIEVTKTQETKDEGTEYYVQELSHDKLVRTFRIPTGVKKENPTAALKDGILTVAFDKAECAKKIEIKLE